MYNLTGIGDSVNLLQYFENVNTALDGYLGILFMMITFIFVWSLTNNRDVLDSLLISSFVTTIISTLLFILGWIDTGILVIPVVVITLLLIMKLLNTNWEL